MMAQKCHKTCICEKLCAGLLSLFISSHKGVITSIENRCRDVHACFISVISSTTILSMVGLMATAATRRVTRPAACNEIFYCLHVSLRHEDRKWVMIWGIAVTTFPFCLVVLLGEARIYADDSIGTGKVGSRISTRSTIRINFTHTKSSLLWCPNPPKHVGQRCRRYSFGLVRILLGPS